MAKGYGSTARNLGSDERYLWTERSAIDLGRTGDKIAGQDPAAAPMEADAESAGTPTPRAALEAASAEQSRLATRNRHPWRFGTHPQPGIEGSATKNWLLAAGLAGLVAAGLAMALASFPPG